MFAAKQCVTAHHIGAGRFGLNVVSGTATKLAFTVQPTNSAPGAAFVAAVTVSVEDPNGNVVTTASNAITLAGGGGARVDR